MQENVITLAGNLVEDPKLRRTKSGLMVTNFRIACTPRRYDATAGGFVDGSTLFMNVSVWRTMAHHVPGARAEALP